VDSVSALSLSATVHPLWQVTLIYPAI
jgi:hypothetical protein